MMQLYKAECRDKSAEEDADEVTRMRQHARPWMTKYLEVGGITLPFSPASAMVLFLSIFYIYFFWAGAAVYCTASHILVKDGPDTKKKLADWKAKIGSDYALFAKYAQDHSECPSKRDGGSLGRFKRMVMAPPFDALCFDPKSPVGTTIGPIQTQFGWHLIYIQDRQLPT
jgi:peptidyl-prolyl cis-trans isomerase C